MLILNLYCYKCIFSFPSKLTKQEWLLNLRLTNALPIRLAEYADPDDVYLINAEED